MQNDFEKLNSIFKNALLNLPGYQTALDIATRNSKGNLWLIGGMVSRLLIQELYKIKQDKFDYDFICDSLVQLLDIPSGWSVTFEKFGNPTFHQGETEIDVWPLSTQNYIRDNNLPPTIDNFLKGVPFTVQAIVFDIRQQKLVGDIGIQSILERTFGVNNLETSREMAARKGTTIDGRMQKIAESMGMTVKPVGE